MQKLKNIDTFHYTTSKETFLLVSPTGSSENFFCIGKLSNLWRWIQVSKILIFDGKLEFYH